ncbi:MAG: hypothetical protein LBQ31_01785 [Bacteroidales bacterium]|jgi:hypothetical protein|nr:hypothetical protein [Bacteroidales bacterium]
MKRNIILFCVTIFGITTLKAQSTIDVNLTKIISQVAQRTAKKIVKEKNADSARIYAGCLHSATLWNPKTDGDEYVYEEFCINNFVNDTTARRLLGESISNYSRSIFGHQKAMEYELLITRDYTLRPLNWFDYTYSQYNPVRFYSDNFYENKLAFAIALNFPYVPWREKEKRGGNLQQWKYYRLGDMFVSRQSYEIAGEAVEAERTMRQYSMEFEMNLSREELILHSKKIERYKYLLEFMKAQLKSDNYLRANFLMRMLDSKYESSLDEMKLTLENFLKGDDVKQTCKLLNKNLNRDLTSEDLYATEKDSVKYPYKNVGILSDDMPKILENAGFSQKDIQTILQNITIEAINGEGTFYYDALPHSKGHLLVNIDDTGVSASSFRIAVHNMGCLIATMIAAGAISSDGDSTFDYGRNKLNNYFMGNVPNEFFANGLGMYLLEKNNMLSKLRFLPLMEKAGMALVELYTWEAWYKNTSMTAAELRDEVQKNSEGVWNKYFSKYFNSKDDTRLSANFLMTASPLSLVAYAYGDMTEIKVCDIMSKSDNNFFRIYGVGKLTPSLWFKNAIGR